MSTPDRQPVADPHRLSVVLCGSFRRSPGELRALHGLLSRHFHLLSPTAVDWIDPTAEFVRLPHESRDSSDDIERRHLAAIRNADFVWLFCPGGYVGSSAAMEIGFADALGIPVLSDVKPADEALANMVQVVDGGPTLAPVHLDVLPGNGIAALQDYYRRVATRRGWSSESARDTLLLLTEEMGELARAVRKHEGLLRDGGYDGVDVALELADVQLYLVHLANALNVDLAGAVTAKELVNAQRFDRRSAA